MINLCLLWVSNLLLHHFFQFRREYTEALLQKHLLYQAKLEGLGSTSLINFFSLLLVFSYQIFIGKILPRSMENGIWLYEIYPHLGYTMFLFCDSPRFSAWPKYCGILFYFWIVGWTRHYSSWTTLPFFPVVYPFSRLLSLSFKMEQDFSLVYKLGPYSGSTQ